MAYNEEIPWARLFIKPRIASLIESGRLTDEGRTWLHHAFSRELDAYALANPKPSAKHFQEPIIKALEGQEGLKEGDSHRLARALFCDVRDRGR